MRRGARIAATRSRAGLPHSPSSPASSPSVGIGDNCGSGATGSGASVHGIKYVRSPSRSAHWSASARAQRADARSSEAASAVASARLSEWRRSRVSRPSAIVFGPGSHAASSACCSRAIAVAGAPRAGAATRLNVSRSPRNARAGRTCSPARASRPGRSVRSRPARLPLSTDEMYRGSSGASDRVSYQLKKWPRWRSIANIVSKARAVRSTSRPVEMYPKSRADRLASSARPMFVGDVRCATPGAGDSW